jgi:competence protein ComEC
MGPGSVKPMARGAERNSFGRSWPAALMAALVAGAGLQLQAPALLDPWIYAALLGVGVLVLPPAVACAGGRLRVAWVVGAALAMGFGLAGVRAVAYAQTALAPSLEGRDLVVEGRVAAMPQRGDGGLRFRFDVESARAGEARVALPPRILLGWYGGAGASEGGVDLQRLPAELRPGERWRFTVRLKAPHGHLNPGGFDYELWLWEQGLQATGYVRAGPRDPVPHRLAATWGHPVEQLRHRVRDAIEARVTDRRVAGVLAALVVGDQAAIERADWDVFRATGVAHLMSISGLHVTMFAWAAAALVGVLWRRSARLCLAYPAQQASLVGGLVLATAYALFSGWGVPAQRTIWMLAAVSLLRLAGRRWPWPWVWLLACAVVVTLDPWALMQAGFWLSFVAVGVLFATGSAPGAMPSARGWRVVALVREQWVVTAALTPLSLLLFGQVSLVGLLANLFAIPWVTLVVTPLAMAGALLPLLWVPAAWSVQGLSEILRLLAQWPWATASLPAAPLWAAAAGVAGGVLLVLRWPWPLRWLGGVLLLPVLLWQPWRPTPGQFDLIAADVGQGNAVVVRTATRTLVYDAGPRYGPESDAGHRVLVPLLRHLGERVDTLVLSHRDADHTGGAAAVLAMQPQAGLLSSLEDGHPLSVQRPGRRCVTGQAWTWDAVHFEVLHPQPADYLGAARPNAISCVLRVSNGRASVLLAGDIEQPQETRLASQPGAAQRLAADALLVPHHGSKTSSSPLFLDAVQPAVAFVQAGYRNRFGHPAPAVAARYAERGIVFATSTHCGAAHWRSEIRDRVDCERDRARRYWHHMLPRPDSP